MAGDKSNKKTTQDGNCGGFGKPKGHLDTQMYPECEGTQFDRDIVKKTIEQRKKHKESSTFDFDIVTANSLKSKVTVIYPSNPKITFEITIPESVINNNDEDICSYVWEKLEAIDNNKIRNSMVGDIYVVNNKNYLVLGIGFTQISDEELKIWIKLPPEKRLMALDEKHFKDILKQEQNIETSAKSYKQLKISNLQDNELNFDIIDTNETDGPNDPIDNDKLKIILEDYIVSKRFCDKNEINISDIDFNGTICNFTVKINNNIWDCNATLDPINLKVINGIKFYNK